MGESNNVHGITNNKHTPAPNRFDNPAAAAATSMDSSPGGASPVAEEEGGGGEAYNSQKADNQEKRARRRRVEAVSRLVADATRPPDFLLDEAAISEDLFKANLDGTATGANNANGAPGSTATNNNNQSLKDEEYSNQILETAKLEARLRSQQHSTLLLASTVASSIERGLDRELHTELVRQGKDAQSVISKICHDHSEDFLESVGKVVAALGGPCEEVKSSLEEVSFIFWLLHYVSCGLCMVVVLCCVGFGLGDRIAWCMDHRDQTCLHSIVLYELCFQCAS